MKAQEGPGVAEYGKRLYSMGETMSKRQLFLGVVVCLVLASCAFADTMVGKNEPGNGNCFPFTCNNSGVTTGLTSEYQQVYSAMAFSGPETIYGLTYYFDNGGSTEVLTGTYDIFLSTTAAVVNGLSGDPAANRGTDYTGVDVFHGGVNSDPSFTIALTTPFSYNPANGNLLLEVMAFNQPDITDTGENAFLQADHSGDVTSRAWGSSTSGPLLNTDSIGLVTTFDTTPVAAPEPGSLSLLFLGLAGASFSLVRVRK
jgi:PEP-CTERM motif